MSAKVNYILKTTNTKAGQIKKALSDAGIEVRSIVEVYREDELTKEPESAGEADVPVRKNGQ